MSAGEFITVQYQASYDPTVQHPIRVQEETPEAETANAPVVENAGVTGLTPNPISAVSSRSQRSLGLRPRTISLELLGTAPSGYKGGSRTSIPALNITFFNSVTKGTEIAYLGTTWTVTGKTAEVAQ